MIFSHKRNNNLPTKLKKQLLTPRECLNSCFQFSNGHSCLLTKRKSQTICHNLTNHSHTHTHTRRKVSNSDSRTRRSITYQNVKGKQLLDRKKKKKLTRFWRINTFRIVYKKKNKWLITNKNVFYNSTKFSSQPHI